MIGPIEEQKVLDCYLAVLQNDPHRLKNHWERYYHSKYRLRDEFLDAAGDLPIEDDEIITSIVNIVKNSPWFDELYLAMLTLGKIGPQSGKLAAKVIVKNINDSSKHMTIFRNLVVDRILKPHSCWIQCDRCNKGYVKDYSSKLLMVGNCNKCLGLGYILR